MHDETGSISPAVAVMGMAFLLLVGLVIDSARDLNARGRATAYAQEAARAGAGAIDPTDSNTALLVNPLDGADSTFPTAGQRADDYCTAAMAADRSLTGCCPVLIDDAHVVVRTKMKVSTSLLGLIGIDELDAAGVGQAEPVQGALAPDAPPASDVSPPAGCIS